MADLIQRVRQKFTNRLFRNLGYLVGGTALAQALSILVLPIITRLYTPEDFSVLAAFTSIVSMISVISCLRFEIAIPIPKKEGHALGLFVLSLISTVLVSLLLIVAIYFFSDQLNRATNDQLIGYQWIIPIAVFISGLYGALQYLATRDKAFILIAKTRVGQALTSSGAQVCLGLLGIAPFGLLFGFILSIGSGVVALARHFIKTWLARVESIRFRKLLLILYSYRRYPKYSVLEAFANTGSVHFPILIIAYYALGEEAGFLLLAMKLLSAPMTLIGRSVSQVYLSEAPERYINGQLVGFTYKVIWSLVKVSALPLLCIAIISPFIIPIILGDNWSRAGILITYMTPWFFMQFITSPVSMSLHITNNQKSALILQVIGLILRVASVIFAAYYFNDYISEFYAISGFIFYTIFLTVVLNLVGKSESQGKLNQR
jgi:O-antigen/teichoic acid export membrane protein